MATTEEIRTQYHDEIVMNCVTLNGHIEGAVPIDQSGEAALKFMFDETIKLLIEKEHVPWEASDGVLGIARRFLLATAAGIGRLASAKAMKANKKIDEQIIKDTYDALTPYWESICPLPLVPPRVSCPTKAALDKARTMRFA